MTFLLVPKEKYLFFVLKVLCTQCSFSLPDSGNCYFLVFQNACPNLTFTCPGQLGKCFGSTLHYYMNTILGTQEESESDCQFKR